MPAILQVTRHIVERHPAWLVGAWLVCTVLALVTLIQFASGLPFSTSLSLAEDSVVERAGLRTRVKLPSAYRSEHLSGLIRVYEDGRPLPHRSRPVREIEELGLGRHKVSPAGIHLSATGGGVPFENGKQYTARVPVVPSARTLMILLAGFIALSIPVLRLRACRGSLRSLGARISVPMNQTRWSAAIFAIALAVGGAEWLLRPDFSDGFFTIHGVPHSDAMGWNANALSLKEGHGFLGAFRGHRGGYPLFLGSVYTLFGDSWWVAKATNLFLLATGTMFLFLLGSMVHSRSLGAALAVWTLVDPATNALVHRTLTENLAFALNPAALVFLVAGFRRGRPADFAVASLLLAFSNLSRPFTAFTVFACGGILVWLLFRAPSWPLRKVLRAGFAFLLGLIVVLFPWSLRQKLTFDSWSPSANSSVALFAAAVPAGHTNALNAAHYQMAYDAGIAETDIAAFQAFFKERFREAVLADPAGYLARLGHYTQDFFGWFSLREPWQVALLTLFSALLILAAAWRRRQPWLALLIPLVPALLACMPETLVPPVWILMLGGLPWVAGIPGALLSGTLAGSAFLNVIVGNFALNRSEFLVSSLFCLVALMWLDWLLRRNGGSASLKTAPGSQVAPWNPLTRPILGALALVLVCGLPVMGLRTLTTSAMSWQPDESLAEQALLRTVKQLPGLDANDPRLKVRAVAMNRLQARFPAGEDAGHISRAFEPRLEDRTVIYPRLVTPAGRHRTMEAGQVPGSSELIPTRGDYLLVVLVNECDKAPMGHGRRLMEVLAFHPLAANVGGYRLGKAIYPPASATVKMLLKQSPGL
jgi:hypothetical protein